MKLTFNNQIGLGWVDIEFKDPNILKEDLRENKSLVEHSLKVDFQTFEWLRLNAGVGFRYLIEGEDQIKKAFNAPIYIAGFSIDFKFLYHKLIKKNKD